MVAGMLLLAAGCVGLGVAPGALFGALTRLAPGSPANPAAGDAVRDAAGATGRIALHLPGTGNLPTLGLALVLAGATAALMILRGRRSAAPAPTWVCGQLVEPPLNWTSAGFSKPLRLVLAPALRPRRQITVREEHGVVQEVTYTGDVPPLIDDRLYRPVARWSTAVAAHAARLQSGSLGRYVAYLIGLVVALLGAARLGLFG